MIELGKLNLKAAGASRFAPDMTKPELTCLCNHQRLRVIGSTFFTAVHDPFVGMRKLELLGLSRNNEIEELVGREYTEGACP